ncbi:hypothetical protein COUCH_15380 [Couchioplanes caeruleus]|uniref:hypothetical protein n=1 Tax=Couchioplanes caeruleus TaxID=56438 RepID=UPI0020C0A22A|nr:hypothetical protein [Couchioplanes caeruleus]UQU67564.1 hypothetical protein COUCH_15380 [Couchioplanes caeruleus]
MVVSEAGVGVRGNAGRPSGGSELVDRPDGWRDNPDALAEGVAPVVADNHTRASVASAELDGLWVTHARCKLETARHVSGDHPAADAALRAALRDVPHAVPDRHDPRA